MVKSRPRPTLLPGWMWVPRCRTMIVPGRTASPSKRLTPSRFALLSRPFFVLLPAFLCAIVYSLGSARGRRRRGAGCADSPPPARGGACAPPPRRRRRLLDVLGCRRDRLLDSSSAGASPRRRRLRLRDGLGDGWAPLWRLRHGAGVVDLLHRELREALAVAALAPRADLRLVLEADYLAPFAVLDDLGDDHRVRHGRAAYRHLLPVRDEEHVAQLHAAARRGVECRHAQHAARAHAILLSAGTDYSVYRKPPKGPTHSIGLPASLSIQNSVRGWVILAAGP